MINLLLWIIAILLLFILSPIFYLFAFLNRKKTNLKKWKLDLAITIDCYGNVLGQYFFNATMIKSSGYKAYLEHK